MDLRKFSGFVLLLGIAFLVYGVILVITNQDEMFDSNKAERHPIFGRMDLQEALRVREENQRRAARRSESTTYFIIGGIVCFVGYAMRASATSNFQEQNKNTDQSA